MGHFSLTERVIINSHTTILSSTGIILLTVALFVSARMGIYQEVLYKTHGKHPQEALYYTVCALKYLSLKSGKISIFYTASSSTPWIPVAL